MIEVYDKQIDMDVGEKKKIDIDVGDQFVEDPNDFSMEEINVATLFDDSKVNLARLNEPIINVSTNAKMKQDQENPQCQVGFVDILEFNIMIGFSIFI